VATVLVNDYALTDAEALPILEGWDRAANRPPIAQDYGPGEVRKIIANARRYAKHPRGEKAADAPSQREEAPCATIALPGEESQGREFDEDARERAAILEHDGGMDREEAERRAVRGGSVLKETFERERRGERSTLALPEWPRLSDLSRLLAPGTVTILAGPPGRGKSLLALCLAVQVHRQGVPWVFLPLEDDRAMFQRRLLARLCGSWTVLDDDPGKAGERLETLARYEDELASVAGRVCENPRRARKDNDGKTVIPPLPFYSVMEWASRAAKKNRVCIVDPLSQVDPSGRDPWKEEGAFIRELAGLAAESGTTFLIVAHSVKRSGKSAQVPLSPEDVQGASAITRLAHCVLLLDAHEERESEVWRTGGLREPVRHDRTLLIGKARNAGGAGARIAFRLAGARFEEVGVIVPKGHIGKMRAPDDWSQGGAAR